MSPVSHVQGSMFHDSRAVSFLACHLSEGRICPRSYKARVQHEGLVPMQRERPTDTKKEDQRLTLRDWFSPTLPWLPRCVHCCIFAGLDLPLFCFFFWLVWSSTQHTAYRECFERCHPHHDHDLLLHFASREGKLDAFAKHALPRARGAGISSFRAVETEVALDVLAMAAILVRSRTDAP